MTAQQPGLLLGQWPECTRAGPGLGCSGVSGLLTAALLYLSWHQKADF